VIAFIPRTQQLFQGRDVRLWAGVLDTSLAHQVDSQKLLQHQRSSSTPDPKIGRGDLARLITCTDSPVANHLAAVLGPVGHA
jgi:hypothetical protein